MDQEADVMPTRPISALPVVADGHRSYDGAKPVHEIEEDIARTRVRLTGTIGALERELAPRRVVERGTDLLRSSLEPSPGPFREQAWAYAIPLALIVSGLGWLFALRRQSWQADVPAGFGEAPVDAVEAGETPPPAPLYANLVEPLEPVPLVGETLRSENTAI